MKRFDAFQGLRAVAFALVFISHCTGFIPVRSGGHGAIGVEIFLVLSGFLVEMHFKEQDDRSLFFQALQYTKKKISKFYGLHILTTLVALIPVAMTLISDFSLGKLTEQFLHLLANLFLVQSWIPHKEVYFSLNAVAWYLSTCVFLYFLSPFLHKVIKSIRKNASKTILILVLFVGQVILASSLRSNEYLHPVVYIHPLTRWADFMTGMLLASIYKTQAVQIRHNNVAETVAVVLLGVAVYLFNRLSVAYSYVALSVPAAWALVFILAYQQGYVSRLLSCRVLTFLGNISFEMFMIHLLVIRSWEYAQWVARRIFGRPIPGILSALCVFAITVVGAWLIQKVMTTMKKKKQEAVHERE